MVSTAAGFNGKRFARGIAVLIACACLVSAASYAIFPASFIFFGVLHCIAVSRILGLAFLRNPGTALTAGVALTAAGHLIRSPVFDAHRLQWIGFMTYKPITEDYVPLAPWFGVFLIGMGAAGIMLSHQNSWTKSWSRQHRGIRGLAFAGRHSLLIYLLHQPFFFAIIWLAARLR